jgi:hypothetical protein
MAISKVQSRLNQCRDFEVVVAVKFPLQGKMQVINNSHCGHSPSNKPGLRRWLRWCRFLPAELPLRLSRYDLQGWVAELRSRGFHKWWRRHKDGYLISWAQEGRRGRRWLVLFSAESKNEREIRDWKMRERERIREKFLLSKILQSLAIQRI